MKKIYALACLLFISYISFGQVGVNTNTPNPHTALDVDNETVNGNTVFKGVKISGVTLQQRDNDFIANELPDGMLIYNDEQQEFNYFDENINSWRVIEKTEQAVFNSYDCDNITVHGTFDNENSLNVNNYLMIPVTVASAGDYEIRGIAYKYGTFGSATPVTNGYYFYASGKVLAPGNVTIPVPAIGKPINNSTQNEPDLIVIYINDNTTVACNTTVNVDDVIQVPAYTIQCGSLALHGSYIRNQEVTPSENFLTCIVQANAEAQGAPYEIKAESGNGYSFSANGTLQQGINLITLRAEGTPLLNRTDILELQTNSTIAQTPCSIPVTVASRAIKILTTGELAYTISTGNSYSIISNDSLFGVNATAPYPVNGIQVTRQIFGSAPELRTYIANNSPDIIHFGYNVTAITDILRELLTEYVNNGGVLLYCSEGEAASTGARNNYAQLLMRRIFDNNTTIQVTGYNDGGSSTASSLIRTTDTPLSNYIYDIKGQPYVNDATSNFGVIKTSIPSTGTWVINSKPIEEDVEAVPTSSARALIHNTKGFLFIGDGGAFSNNVIQVSGSNNTPASTGAQFFTNVIGWAIDMVNNHRPVGNEPLLNQ